MTGSTLGHRATHDAATAEPAQQRLVVAAGLVRLHSQLLVQRRPATARHGAGALELPGGKLEPGEGPRAALARELLEEWGPAARELEIGGVADVLHHMYPAPGPEVILIVLHVDARRWSSGWRELIQPEPGVEVLAFEIDELPLDQFLAADRPFLAGLRTR
ncbi:5-methyl-dCTP pyrophosphohydrolase [Enhygromyxa salina]|uniref:8-oxo-dGTP diphosphatase n=1 Tax=Enhygromyxa salina TaxID=215803 RepID=A0A0C1ZQJ6_9BACT|nr:NUDIX domain-containing protein [Enhygromyxa salina]KIG13213.1 5-methyl-dCTP pyrophosphohydrolase [Enhygromyxa salina]